MVDVIKLEVTEGVVWYMSMGGEPPLGEQRKPTKSWTCLLSSASIRLEDSTWQLMMIVGSSVLAACCEVFDGTGERELSNRSPDRPPYIFFCASTSNIDVDVTAQLASSQHGHSTPLLLLLLWRDRTRGLETC